MVKGTNSRVRCDAGAICGEEGTLFFIRGILKRYVVVGAPHRDTIYCLRELEGMETRTATKRIQRGALPHELRTLSICATQRRCKGERGQARALGGQTAGATASVHFGARAMMLVAVGSVWSE
jgi:hypothetical protein